jgi:hypothetical protein
VPGVWAGSAAGLSLGGAPPAASPLDAMFVLKFQWFVGWCLPVGLGSFDPQQ